LICASHDQALVCTSGAWRATPCRGPGGCGPNPDHAHGGTSADRCDDTIAAEGDACLDGPAADYACTRDHARALVCSGGHFNVWRQCRGEHACAIDANRHLDCDTTLGAAGDPCEKQGAYACSIERDVMLQCRGMSLVASSSCRGPEGCRFDRERHRVDCDDGTAREGDPCEVRDRVACAVGGKYELVCESRASEGDADIGTLTYAKKRECRRTDCRVDGNDLYCD
jgi:hypothetical protein